MATVTINKVKCIRVSLGYDKEFGEVMKVLGGLGTSFASGFSSWSGVPMYELGAESTEEIMNAIGTGSPDELYIKIGGKRVWGGKRGKNINGGQTKEVNVSQTFSGSTRIELKEWDFISSDDFLGGMDVTESTRSGEYLVGNEREQSLYVLDITVN